MSQKSRLTLRHATHPHACRVLEAIGCSTLHYNYYDDFVTKMARTTEKGATVRSRYGLFQGLFNPDTGKYERGNCPELLPDGVPIKGQLADLEEFLCNPERFDRAMAGFRAMAIKQTTWEKYLGMISRVMGYASSVLGVPQHQLGLELFSNHRILHACYDDMWRSAPKGTGVPNQVSAQPSFHVSSRRQPTRHQSKHQRACSWQGLAALRRLRLPAHTPPRSICALSVFLLSRRFTWPCQWWPTCRYAWAMMRLRRWADGCRRPVGTASANLCMCTWGAEVM